MPLLVSGPSDLVAAASLHIYMAGLLSARLVTSTSCSYWSLSFWRYASGGESWSRKNHLLRAFSEGDLPLELTFHPRRLPPYTFPGGTALLHPRGDPVRGHREQRHAQRGADAAGLRRPAQRLPRRDARAD